MEITIGVRNVARELILEVSEDADTLAKKVNEALAKAEREPGATLDLTSTKGRRVIVPVAAVGFVEFGVDEQPTVGFGAL